MSARSKRELLIQIAPQYREASRAQKTAILDQFVVATGYARKHALRLMANPPAVAEPIWRPRAPTYGPVRITTNPSTYSESGSRSVIVRHRS